VRRAYVCAESPCAADRPRRRVPAACRRGRLRPQLGEARRRQPRARHVADVGRMSRRNSSSIAPPSSAPAAADGCASMPRSHRARSLLRCLAHAGIEGVELLASPSRPLAAPWNAPASAVACRSRRGRPRRRCPRAGRTRRVGSGVPSCPIHNRADFSQIMPSTSQVSPETISHFAIGGEERTKLAFQPAHPPTSLTLDRPGEPPVSVTCILPSAS
jgi:hypothetical protein